MVVYVLKDTFFDKAKSNKGSILSTHHFERLTQPRIREAPICDFQGAKFADEGPDGFRALKYEDVVSRNAEEENENGEGASHSTKKAREPSPIKIPNTEFQHVENAAEGPDSFQATRYEVSLHYDTEILRQPPPIEGPSSFAQQSEYFVDDAHDGFRAVRHGMIAQEDLRKQGVEVWEDVKL